jgi:hypothetical protein
LKFGWWISYFLFCSLDSVMELHVFLHGMRKILLWLGTMLKTTGKQHFIYYLTSFFEWIWQEIIIWKFTIIFFFVREVQE